MFKFLVVIFVFGAYILKITEAQIKKCTNEKDCNSGSVCNEGVCQKCLDCQLLKRKGTSCKLDFSECEDCLEGYEYSSEGKFKHHSPVIKYCTPVKVLLKADDCFYDRECPPNMYCLFHSCKKCFNCTVYNRLPPASMCAKQVEDCGSCIAGYYEVPVTTIVNNKPCVLMATQNEKKIVSKSSINFVLIYIIASLSLVLCFVYLLLFILKRKSNSCQLDQLRDVPLLSSNAFCESNEPLRQIHEPPPYSPSCDIQVKDKLYVEEPYLEMNLEIEEMQCARVFKEPTAPYYESLSFEERRNNPVQNVSVSTQISNEVNSPNHNEPPSRDNLNETSENIAESGNGENIASDNSSVEENNQASSVINESNEEPYSSG